MRLFVYELALRSLFQDMGSPKRGRFVSVTRKETQLPSVIRLSPELFFCSPLKTLEIVVEIRVAISPSVDQ